MRGFNLIYTSLKHKISFYIKDYFLSRYNLNFGDVKL